MAGGRALLCFVLVVGTTLSNWPAHASEVGEERALLCLEGKSIPQLYLLGVAKAGTTSIAMDMFTAGFKSAAGTKNSLLQQKELHTFESFCKNRERICPATTTADMRREWVTRFTHACGTKGLTDCTPRNFGFSGLPQMLKDLYGQSIRELRFLVVLREPISRMLSHYTQIAHRRKKTLRKALKAAVKRKSKTGAGKANAVPSTAKKIESFQRHVDRINESFVEKQSEIRRKALRHDGGDNVQFAQGFSLLYVSLYAPHFSRWLDSFPADQFTVLPRMRYFDSGEHARGLLQHVARSMGLTINASRVKVASHHTHKEHAGVEDLLKNASRHWLNKEFFEPDLGQLSRLLSAAAKKGLYLHGFAAKPTPENVHEYLASSW